MKIKTNKIMKYVCIILLGLRLLPKETKLSQPPTVPPHITTGTAHSFY